MDRRGRLAGIAGALVFHTRGGRDQALFHPSLSPGQPGAREVYYADLELSALFHPLESLSPPAPNPFSRCL